MSQGRYLDLSFTSPAAPNTPGAVVSQASGIGEYPLWIFGARLAAVAGGILDIVMQTADIPETVIPSKYTGPWFEIWRQTLAAGATTPAFRFSFARGFTAPATATAENQTDISGTPTLATGVILNWANGNAVRIYCLAGVGVATGILQTITGFVSES